MSDQHELKTWPKYFDSIWSGKKTFEIRKDDRDFKVGDSLLLREWSPEEHDYTGNWIVRLVTHVMRGAETAQFGLQSGYCIMSLSPSVVAGLKRNFTSSEGQAP